MTVDLQSYRSMLERPWGKIQYQLTFAQLEHLKNKRILDFGAGFGLTAQFLSKHNQVVAIEPNENLLFADDTQNFEKILGSLEQLRALESEQFEVIICHNVLEYIPKSEHKIYLAEFERLLKANGELSLIKHNIIGKIMQNVIFNNDTDTALRLLQGQDSFKTASFTQGSTYTMEELLANTSLNLVNYRGLRTFYSLQPNDFKTHPDWLDKMTEVELTVADRKPYKDIAFLQHLTLVK